MCELAREMRNVIIAGRDLNDFGKLLHISWELKRSLTHNISNPQIDSYYERAIEAGALGGKLLGAGNGGFILLYCEPHRQNRVREALCDLEESPFALEPQGSKIIYVDDMKNDLETVRFS
jgi:D-glycero-alpha-D-manno-heptose-7-phosphate kinase